MTFITGLPDGKSEEELTKYMSKCGGVDIDVRTNKVKLCRDSEGNCKGMYVLVCAIHVIEYLSYF